MKPVTQLKQEVASYISQKLNDKDLILLGSGSTVNQVIKASDLSTTFVSSSRLTSLKIQEHNRREILLDEILSISEKICVDGADQVLEEGGIIIKGHGGALLREKITWEGATRIIVAIDETKLSDKLNKTIPVVIHPQAIRTIQKQINQIREIESSQLHMVGGLPYNTDDGLVILHLYVNPSCDLIELNQNLRKLSGVIETGIFVRSDYDQVEFICATQDGIQEF